MIDTHKEILFLVKERKWKQDKAEDIVNLLQRQAEKGYENLMTKTDLAKFDKVLDVRFEQLEGHIKVLKIKIIMFMWFITVGVTLFEIIHCLMSIKGK